MKNKAHEIAVYLGIIIVLLLALMIYCKVKEQDVSAQEQVNVEALEAERLNYKPADMIDPAQVSDEPMRILLGEFYITVYTPECDGGKWGYNTATGIPSEHLKTCAVDPNVISMGSTVEIVGLGRLKAVDTGSAVKGNIIDIFYDGTNKEAKEWLKGFGTSHTVYEIFY